MKNLIVFLFCFFLLLNGRLLSYTLDSNEIMLAVIDIGNYNNDGVQDTLVGAFLQNMDLKPKYIGWGIDSTNQSSGIVPQTKINYPDWNDLNVACNINNANADNLKDIHIYISGSIDIDTLTTKDTTTAIILFGQNPLGFLPQISLENLPPMQMNPFVCLKMGYGSEFGNEAPVDDSRRYSYEIFHVPMFVPPVIHTDVEDTDPEPEAIIYPNPAVYYTNLEINNLGSGAYYVEVFDINGNLMIEKEIINQSGSKLIKTLDLSNLFNGVYYLRIYQSDKVILNSPIVIKR